MNLIKPTFVTCLLFCALTVLVRGQTNSPSHWSWVADSHERGHGLPPGVPRVVDTNGNVEYIYRRFTSKAYVAEASRLMIQEANHAAQALQIGEDLPISRSKTHGADVTTFDFFYRDGLLGSVSTTNYTYRFLNGGKLDHVEIDHSYEVWRYYQNTLLPEGQADNHAAYLLASQWLASVSVDVKALNRDCQLTVASSPVFNYVGSGKEPIKRMFAPTYDVIWRSSNGPAAGVQLYLPDKLLIRLSIDDPKYNLRAPLVFTNLAALFPGQAQIITNHPVPTVLVDMGPLNPVPETTFITDSNQPEPLFHGSLVSRWIQTQTQLNTNHLSLSELMTLKQVAGPDVRGLVTFDVPVRFDALHYPLTGPPIPSGTVDIGNFDSEGNFIEYTLFDCKRAPSGDTRFCWNINFDSPGRHELRARMRYYQGMDGDQINLIGPPLSYWSSNSCSFYLSASMFSSDVAYLYAKLREPVAKFRIKITSLKGRLINDISGSATNGEINLSWDLTGLDGQKYTNHSFLGSFYVTYPDDKHANPPATTQFNRMGTAAD